jgi:hypothetical protein
MAIPERFPWLRAFWARMSMDEPTNPLMWRDRFGRLMLAYGAIVLPLAMIYIVPVYIAERRYGLIALDVAFWLFMICQLRVFRFPSRIN